MEKSDKKWAGQPNDPSTARAERHARTMRHRLEERFNAEFDSSDVTVVQSGGDLYTACWKGYPPVKGGTEEEARANLAGCVKDMLAIQLEREEQKNARTR